MEPIFKSLKVLKIQHTFDLAQLKFYHKYIHIKLPYRFQNFSFVLNENFHGRCTRQRHYIHTNRVYHSFAEKCIRYSVPRLINGTNTNIYDKFYTHIFDGFVQFTKRFLSRIILKTVPLSTVMFVKLIR